MNNIQKLQNQASNPNKSIWVNANAGTGKTKVLVDRILRILISNVPHTQILCITYTKAAAHEITNRIMKIIAKWTYIETNILTKELQSIGIENVTEEILYKARTLCNEILDSNIQLQIKTIHGFCANLLEEFFIEADLSKQFSILEDNHIKNIEIKEKVFNNTIIHLLNTNEIHFKKIIMYFSTASLRNFISTDISNFSIEINKIKETYKDINNLKAEIFKFFKVPLNMNYKNYLKDTCNNSSFDYNNFVNLVNILNNIYSSLSNAEQEKLSKIQTWLNSTASGRASDFDNWYNIFITKENTPKKNVINKKTIKVLGSSFEDLINNETLRLLKIKEAINNFNLADYNFEFLKLSLFINTEYLKQKEEQNFVDYNDILELALRLLKKDTFIPWLFYTLNQRISHILVDESQDTSPMQWEIIKIIAKEIFSTNEKNKSIFIVGDLKQSIYSFQGSNPEMQPEVKSYLRNLIEYSNNIWEEINFNTSFRSSNAVLELVNKVSYELFSNEEIHKNENLFHNCFNKSVTGLVEIWPSITTTIEDNQNTLENLSSDQLLAKAVSTRIINLIKIEKYKPKDIMILFKKRANNETLLQIIRLLKNNNIPVSGLDKLNLISHMAIMDIISIAKFLLQPLYNLNLATLLKSPIFSFTDNELVNLLLETDTKYLWHTLKAHSGKKHVYAKNKLLNWQNMIKSHTSLISFFLDLIHNNDLYNLYITNFGTEVVELFNEFINIVIDFENNNTNKSLENFIYFLDQINPNIKKELDNESNTIKFLTIHGSKGLESKLVFLIDTPSGNSSNNGNVIKTNLDNLPIIFKFSKKSGFSSSFQANIVEEKKSYLEAEEKRLLYVALTRAKEKLYICSNYKNNKSKPSFYNYIISSLNTEAIESKDDFFNNNKYGFENNKVIILK